MSVQGCSQVKVYLFLVNDFSYGTDHAGSAGTKQSSDPLLLYSEAQLSHGHVVLRHPEVSLEGKRKWRQIWNIAHVYFLVLFILLKYFCIYFCVNFIFLYLFTYMCFGESSYWPISWSDPGHSVGSLQEEWFHPEEASQVPPLKKTKKNTSSPSSSP